MSSVKIADADLPSLDVPMSPSEFLRAVAEHGMYPGEKGVAGDTANKDLKIPEHYADYLSGYPNVD